MIVLVALSISFRRLDQADAGTPSQAALILAALALTLPSLAWATGAAPEPTAQPLLPDRWWMLALVLAVLVGGLVYLARRAR